MVAAAGDIACDPAYAHSIKPNPGLCQDQETSALLNSARFAAVLPLGDLQYDNASASQIAGSYQKSWGAWKSVTRPTVGNHEYQTPQAAGYFNYFGIAAGDRSTGYYSYDLGTWHLISLNANCFEIGGCRTGSAQEQWLRQDLAAHTAACTLAYWHIPRFSSGPHQNDMNYLDFWRDLYAAHADIVLNGHDHDYERFAPQTPDGQRDDAAGIRAFVVGTGGREHYPIHHVQRNSEIRNDSTFGILALTLGRSSYTWNFIPEKGFTFTDSGSASCHGH